MSINLVERDGEFFEKPLNPMNPNYQNWDVSLTKRVTMIEKRLEDLEINIFLILKSLMEEISKEKRQMVQDVQVETQTDNQQVEIQMDNQTE